MFWIFLFLLFVFPHSVLASAQVTIVTPPDNIVIGDSFPVVFTIFSVDTGLSYRYKIVADPESNIITVPDSGCSGAYDKCPIIAIGDTAPVTAIAYAKLNNVTSASIKIRLAQDDNHDHVYNSSVIVISGAMPTSSPTPTSTNTPVPRMMINPTMT